MSKRDKILRLMDILGTMKYISDLFNDTLAVVGHGLSEDRFKELAIKINERVCPKIQEEISDIYDQLLSEEQTDQLLEWYDGPGAILLKVNEEAAKGIDAIVSKSANEIEKEINNGY